jgi:hypothetical protein
MPFAVVSDHRPVLAPLHVSLSLRDCPALKIAGLQAVLRTGHRMPDTYPFHAPPFSGFLVSFSFLATLIRLLNDVTIASRPRLPTFQRRYLEYPDLTVYTKPQREI